MKWHCLQIVGCQFDEVDLSSECGLFHCVTLSADCVLSVS